MIAPGKSFERFETSVHPITLSNVLQSRQDAHDLCGSHASLDVSVSQLADLFLPIVGAARALTSKPIPKMSSRCP
jgi:hypothetical protein